MYQNAKATNTIFNNNNNATEIKYLESLILIMSICYKTKKKVHQSDGHFHGYLGYFPGQFLIMSGAISLRPYALSK